MLVIIRKVKIIHIIQDDAGQDTDNQTGEAGMYLAHFHAWCTLAGPELIFIGILRGLLVHLLQLVTIATVPDTVPDGIGLKVQDLINLDVVPACRYHIQPAADTPLDCLIHIVQPPHLFSASSNPIRFRYGIHAY